MPEPNYKGHPIFYNPQTGVGVCPIEDAGAISDGYHTFEEIYDHRCLLFCALIESMKFALFKPWKSRLHSDGNGLDGWFIAGITLPDGPITYHLPTAMWDLCHAEELERAPEWDGHTSADVVERLRGWLR